MPKQPKQPKDPKKSLKKPVMSGKSKEKAEKQAIHNATHSATHSATPSATHSATPSATHSAHKKPAHTELPVHDINHGASHGTINNPALTGDIISIRGARTHNLKNITVDMPRNKMVVITGLSGSGKSSLAFDTIFAEGQRRYIESLSSYARQFLRQLQKPDVDEIVGLSPAISIDQKSRSNNPRSTVATITEIYDYLRILFARIGKPHCLICGREIKKLSKEEILSTIFNTVTSSSTITMDGRKAEHGGTPASEKVMGVDINKAMFKIYAPVVIGRKGEYYQMLYDLLGKGYEEVRIDGIIKNLRGQIILSKTKKHNIDVLVDQFYISEIGDNSASFRERLNEAVEKALHEADGLIRIISDADEAIAGGVMGADGKTLVGADGKKKKSKPKGDAAEAQVGHLISSKFMCPHDGFSFPEVEPRLFSFNSPYGACSECNGLGTREFFIKDPCPVCRGARLRPEALHVFLKSATQMDSVIDTLGDVSGLGSVSSMGRGSMGSLGDVSGLGSVGGGTGTAGRADKKNINVVDLTKMTIQTCIKFFETLPLTPTEEDISRIVIKEIVSRLRFMENVGIEYLSLDRRANTLSGGEAQRIRLASQLGSGLVGAMYVLDEPTIGLHQRDNDRLIHTLLQLRDMGNSVIVVEHDEDTIFSADYIVDIGPGAGVHGGHVAVSGWLDKLLTAKTNLSNSVTLEYLRGEKVIELPERRRDENNGWIKIVGASVNNIKNQNVDVPLGRMTSVTGVSGSGKSSLVYEVLHKNLLARLDRDHRSANIYNCSSFSGTEYLGRTVLIDQSPIGRTPRSNPATYTGAFTHIRDLFAETIEARARGWKSSRFSFNVKGGRCENCQGNGMIEVEMHFLPTVYVTCDICNGKRFMKETLEVKYKNKNIYDVLKMTVEESIVFFEEVPSIYDRLKTLQEVGLGYLELGQSATTLSGGEAQRVKVSSELYREHIQKTIYLLDEPTIGLHYEDVKKLIDILKRLVRKGNTVVIIEHNMDIIKSSDYIIDIGPDGGDKGGKIVAVGTPEEVAKNPASHTGQHLNKVLKKWH